MICINSPKENAGIKCNLVQKVINKDMEIESKIIHNVL